LSRKEVTFVLVPNYQNKSYTKTISLFLLRTILVLVVVFIVGLGVLSLLTTRFYYRLLKLNYLNRRYAELEKEHAKIQSLKDKLAQLEQESEKIKNMLGVDKTPPPVDFVSLKGNYQPAAPEKPARTEKATSEILTSQAKKTKFHFIPIQIPLSNYVVSKGFSITHQGIDLVASLGSKVLATADGIIKKTGDDSVYGKYVLMQHGKDYTSFYGHLSRATKSRGDTVERGTVIGYLGATGRVSAPHLHFEITYKGEKVDPAKILKLNQ